MEKLRRGKACRDPNSPLTGKASSGGSDRIAAQAMAHFPPPCFSHKTLRGQLFFGSPEERCVSEKHIRSDIFFDGSGLTREFTQ